MRNDGEKVERYFAVGTRVQHCAYTVRHKHQTWMLPQKSDEAPFAVLSSMADHEECNDPEKARARAAELNEAARVAGTLQTETVVVP